MGEPAEPKQGDGGEFTVTKLPAEIPQNSSIFSSVIASFMGKEPLAQFGRVTRSSAFEPACFLPQALRPRPRNPVPHL